MTAVAVQTSDETSVIMTPQPHGGALRVGGRRGNGGGGRTPDRIRRLARMRLPEGVELMTQLMRGVAVEFVDDGKLVLISPTPAERVSAYRALLETGMGPAVVLADVRERLQAQAVVVRQHLPPEQAETLLAALSKVWK